MYSLGIPKDIDPCIYVAKNLKEIFADNDIIVVLESANEQTYCSVNKELLSLIKPGGVFVNSARGMIINQDDLTDIALKGEIQIALDVFEPEPLEEESLLRGCENVLLTPHVAGPTKENRALCGMYCLKNVKNFLSGKPVNSIITTEDYDRMSPN